MKGVIARLIMNEVGTLLDRREYEKPVFCVRDDDFGIDTFTEVLEEAYKPAWGMGFIVTFGVVPVFLHKNRELGGWLKAKIREGKADAILHGYRHTRDEFVCDYLTARKQLKAGLQMFKDSLGFKPNVFATPWEDVSLEALKAVSEAGLSYSAYPIKILRWWSPAHNPYMPSRFRGCVILPRLFHVMPHSLNDTFKELGMAFNHRGLACVLTHHKHYHIKQNISKMNKMFAHASKLGFQKKGLNDESLVG